MKLNLRSIDLNLLPVFETVMQTRQYSKAAERLAMSQPAMSAAMQRLRDTLNDPLFIRTRQGLTPTPKAESLYSDVQGALSLIREGLSQQKDFTPDKQAHTFRIASADYFEFVLLPQLIHTFEEDAPDIQFNITPLTNVPESQLLHAQVDVILDAFPIQDDRIHSEIVSYESLVVVARKAHPRINDNLTLDEFFNETHAVLPNQGRLLPLEKVLNKPLSKKRKIGVQVTQYISLLTAVSNSNYIATVPKQLAVRYGEALGLQQLDFPIKVPPIPLFMMWSKAFENDSAHQWLLSQLRCAASDTV